MASSDSIPSTISTTSSQDTGSKTSEIAVPRKNQYHSYFYRLLTWKNPRDSAIAFGVSSSAIVIGHYVNIASYVFKALYIVLGITAAAEIAGRTLLSGGLTTQLRPAKYYTINPSSLERLLSDFSDLVNFFVVGFQEVVFAERIHITGAAFIASYISYWFVRYLPFWGLALLADCIAFLGPLVYLKNQELIDSFLSRSSVLAQEHAGQLKDIANKHADTAATSVMKFTGPYMERMSSFVKVSPPASTKSTDSTTPTL